MKKYDASLYKNVSLYFSEGSKQACDRDREIERQRIAILLNPC